MFDPNKAVEREGMPIRGNGDDQFDECVRRWRLCLRMGLGHRVAHYYRELLRLRGYRGITLAAPNEYSVYNNHLVWFKSFI